MSTLKSINVQHPSASTINIVNDSSGNVTVGNNLTVTGTSAHTGAATFSSTLGVTGNTTLGSYSETVVAIGTVTTSNTLSLTTGTVQTATLTASTACTFTMPTATAGKSFILLLKQAASTGNGTATFTSVKWNSAGAPTITATAGKMDILTFVSDGTNWYGSYSQGYTP
jgi:fibronectin-binding autotransporter adhesin